MKRRGRFEVVVEGPGLDGSMSRTVISAHRDEDDALDAAAVERERIEVLHGGGPAQWRVLVVQGDEVVDEADLDPVDDAPAPPEPPPARPDREPLDEPLPQRAEATWVIHAPEEFIGRERDDEPEPEGEAEPPPPPRLDLLPDEVETDWTVSGPDEFIDRARRRAP
ncbi:MAG: hypothetical protein AB7V42_02220 [Thermoleophilia bacterium]